MAYNADSVDIIYQDNFRLPVEFIASLRKEIGDDHPESCLLYESDNANDNTHFADLDSYRYFSRIDWHGEGSGFYWDTLVDVVLPKFKGAADLIACMEGGDSYRGLRVRDGVVTKHAVVMALGEEEK